MGYLRLFGLYMRVSIINEMQYRVNFFVQLFQSLLSLGTGLIELGGPPAEDDVTRAGLGEPGDLGHVLLDSGARGHGGVHGGEPFRKAGSERPNVTFVDREDASVAVVEIEPREVGEQVGLPRVSRGLGRKGLTGALEPGADLVGECLGADDSDPDA